MFGDAVLAEQRRQLVLGPDLIDPSLNIFMSLIFFFAAWTSRARSISWLRVLSKTFCLKRGRSTAREVAHLAPSSDHGGPDLA